MLISLDKHDGKVSASTVYKFWIESISKFQVVSFFAPPPFKFQCPWMCECVCLSVPWAWTRNRMDWRLWIKECVAKKCKKSTFFCKVWTIVFGWNLHHVFGWQVTDDIYHWTGDMWHMTHDIYLYIHITIFSCIFWSLCQYLHTTTYSVSQLCWIFFWIVSHCFVLFALSLPTLLFLLSRPFFPFLLPCPPCSWKYPPKWFNSLFKFSSKGLSIHATILAYVWMHRCKYDVF